MTVNELLGIALKIEGMGYSYYSRLASNATGEIKKLFEELAIQEREHAKKFEELLKNYGESNQNDWFYEEVTGYATAYAEELILSKLENTEIPEHFKDAVKKAIDVEKDSILFYTEIKALVPDKEALENVINEEKRHLNTLVEKLRDYDSFDMFSEGSKI
ncbi:ferritin family protein [Thermosipho ferrireducens]|uniref:Ferritin family protein n=1 Tax=Thermosipho ferrireducens TaxID=2571116 RepID=A0ABX7S979_9BACT|nr:ferritin family protein [Thermosipho ferrireducens]QTA37740.1 ferritin family protein [Thermosipho ferrireducens]